MRATKTKAAWRALSLGALQRQCVEVRLTPALRASLEADAAAARLTLSDLCRARLGSTGGTSDIRAAYLSGYQAAVREAMGRLGAMLP